MKYQFNIKEKRKVEAALTIYDVLLLFSQEQGPESIKWYSDDFIKCTDFQIF